ncbi:hypothetical protein ACSQ6I_03190 [Anabaena sp. WFMT]|uniref:hypothetical protein n=1 Tax=Anabaena sp. WFMT TaxID=3449730 RepID=UPI003F2681D3
MVELLIYSGSRLSEIQEPHPQPPPRKRSPYSPQIPILWNQGIITAIAYHKDDNLCETPQK